MSRLGTCRHSYQIQVMYRIPVHPQPHEPAEVRIEKPDEYTCQWLDQRGPLPPPIARFNGGHLLRAGDCEVCPHYAAAGGVIPGVKP